MKVCTKFITMCGLATFGLVACSDDVTEVNKDTTISVLESGKALSKQSCDTTNVGEVMYVKDSSATFVCNGESWETFNGEKGGAGEDGFDCTAKKNSDGDYEVTCDGKKIGVVSNGYNGKAGSDCRIASDKDGVVTLVCGDGKDPDSTKLFKAVCGSDSYDPSAQFCYEQKLYSCNGKPYNPVSQYCESKKIKDRPACGEKFYDDALQYCKDGVVLDWDLCNGKPYDSAIKYCDGDEIKNRPTCDGKVYDDGEQFCENGTLFAKGKCNGVSFVPTTHYCRNAETVVEYGSMKDSRNQKTYKTVVVGKGDNALTWLAENMDYALEDQEGEDVDNGEYGHLYTYKGALEACPENWHLPNYSDWNLLFITVESENVAGKMLKSRNGWGENKNGSDLYGFAALPGGFISDNSSPNFHEGAFFWSTRDDGFVTIESENSKPAGFVEADLGARFFSVRCVEGESHEPSPTTSSSTMDSSDSEDCEDDPNCAEVSHPID